MPSDSSDSGNGGRREQRAAERTSVALLRYLLDHPGATAPEASDELGMSFQNVYRLIGDLRAADLLLSQDFKRTSRRGPQSQVVSLRPELGCTLGVDLEATQVRGVVLDFANQDAHVWRHPLAPTDGPREILAAVAEAARSLAAQATAAGAPPLTVGLGLPGPLLDAATGRSHTRYQFGEATLEFAPAVEAACGLHPVTNHNAHCFALGHHRAHNPNRPGIELVLLNRFGLAAALLWDGRLFTGSSSYAGDLGALSCPVGRGHASFNELCTGGALLSLARTRGDGRSFGDLIRHPEDPLVNTWLEKAIPAFAAALHAGALIYNPHRILLEGIFNDLPADSRQRLLELATQAIERSGLQSPTVEFYDSDDLMGARGAAFLARDEVADEALRGILRSRPAAAPL